MANKRLIDANALWDEVDKSKYDNPHTIARPNFEAEFARAMDELTKAKRENETLRNQLEQKEKSLLWYDGIKQTIEVIFGREFYNA